MSKTIVAQFNTAIEAQNAKHELISDGYNAQDIDVLANEQGPAVAGGYTSTATDTESHNGGMMESIKHFFSSLTSADEAEHQHYAQSVARGGALLSVTVPDDHADATMDLLEQYGASDFQDEEAYRSASVPAPLTASAGAMTGEVAIPVVEEELQIGKREVSRGGIRVYSHMVETPVEES